MPKHFTYPLIAGVISACFFLFVTLLGLGFFFMFLPTLPLLVIGLGRDPRMTFKAMFVAAAVIALVGGIPVAIMYLLFLGLPAWYIADKSLLSRANSASGERQWYSMGYIFLNLTLYACAIMASITLYYTTQPGGIEQMLAASMKQEFSDVDGEYADVLNALITKWAFLIFSMTIWLWGLALYAHTWFAERLLANKNKTIRPNVAISLFVMPNWVLSLLGICALASLIGSPSMQFFGKSTLISLLLPYFFLGCAHMHKASLSWPSRRFFLFFVYFMVFAQFWPALILSGAGLWQHIKALSVPRVSSKR